MKNNRAGLVQQTVIEGVTVGVKIKQSALKHGKTAEDVLSVLNTAIYDETIAVDPNKTLIVGYDKSANLTEIIVHVVSDESVIVFHSMACRKVYLKKAIKG
ncbi:MAG: hypothetical protein LBL54_02670 [Clostridiales Family XIII bacterium]|nr:hypothetical protein [Clostridiales Family XIII bacterium]